MNVTIQSTKTWFNVKLSNDAFEPFTEADFDARIAEILESFEGSPKDVIVNFTEVGFLPTICIRQFERLVKGIRGKGCHVAFLNLPESIHSILSSGERSRSSRKFISEKEAVKFVTQKMKKKETTNPFLVCMHA